MPNDPDQGKAGSLECSVVRLTNRHERIEAIEAAFDYRGNVMLTCDDGRVIEGYVFDRCSDVADPYLRLVRPEADGSLTIRYDAVTQVAFTGADTAAGKSWEAWLARLQKNKGTPSGDQATT